MTTEVTEAPAPEAKPKVVPKKSGANNGTKAASPVPPEAEQPKIIVVKEEEESEDVMDLTSLVPTRKLIKVPTDNGISDAYELRLLDDFGIIDQQKLLNWSRRFEKLWNNEEDRDLTTEEQTSLKWLLDKMFNMVLVAPDEIKETMNDAIRSRVVTAFTLVPLLERQKQEQEAQEKEEKEKEEKGKTPTSTSEN